MSNPKTTIAGYLVLLAVLSKVVAGILTGGEWPGMAEITSALVGVGLIAARDGGR